MVEVKEKKEEEEKEEKEKEERKKKEGLPTTCHLAVDYCYVMFIAFSPTRDKNQ